MNCSSMMKDKRATPRWVEEAETCCCPKTPTSVVPPLEEQWVCVLHQAPTLGICAEEMSPKISALENQWDGCPRGPKTYRELRFSFQGTYLWS